MELTYKIIDLCGTWQGVACLALIILVLLWVFSPKFSDFICRIKELSGSTEGVKATFSEENNNLHKDPLISSDSTKNVLPISEYQGNSNLETGSKKEFALTIFKAKSIREAIDIADKYKQDKQTNIPIEEIDAFLLVVLEHIERYCSYEDDLLVLENENNDWFLPKYLLAKYYLSLDAFEQARIYLSKVNALSRNESEIVKCILLESRLLSKCQDVASSIKFVEEKLDQHPLQHELLFEAARLHEQAGHVLKASLLWEEYLQLKPSDTDARFNLAYLYSKESKTQLLACLHYEKLLLIDDQNFLAMNNLAITSKELGLDMKCDDLLNKSKDSEGYSIGNLIIQSVEAGQFIHAKSLEEEIPDHLANSERVVEAKKQLSRSIQDNHKRENATHAASNLNHKFILQSLRQAEDVSDYSRIVGKWENKNYILALKNKNTHLEGSLHEKLSLLSNDDPQFYRVTGEVKHNIVFLEARIDNQPQTLLQEFSCSIKLELILVDSVLRGILKTNDQIKLQNITFKQSS